MKWQAGWLIFAGMLMLGLVVGWALWFAPPRAAVTVEPPVIAEPAEGVFPGKIAPDFRLPTLGGGTVTLGEHRRHRVLLNFFASWCGACRKEMPGVQAQAEKHAAHDWVVLGVNVMEDRDTALAFRDEFELTFPILLDERGLVTRLYLVTGTPTNLFINRDGVIVERQLGYMSEAHIATIIESVP
ncbi:MAG: TlpA family protein disulfide reductase [Chloroflexi bacterium]|nr:TlpA family protein disulfide reductase [Chloroflexota bacterium]